jgi:hypothetical protein
MPQYRCGIGCARNNGQSSIPSCRRLKPSASELHQQKLAVIILAPLVTIFTAIGIYGTIADKWTLQILAYCGAMPTLFGLLAQLAMYFSA